MWVSNKILFVKYVPKCLRGVGTQNFLNSELLESNRYIFNFSFSNFRILWLLISDHLKVASFRGDITASLIDEIKRMLTECYKWLYANGLVNLDEMYGLLERYKLLKLTQKEILKTK